MLITIMADIRIMVLLHTTRTTTVFTCLSTVKITTGQGTISNSSTHIIKNMLITQLSIIQNTMVSRQLLITLHITRSSIIQPSTDTFTE